MPWGKSSKSYSTNSEEKSKPQSQLTSYSSVSRSSSSLREKVSKSNPANGYSKQ